MNETESDKLRPLRHYCVVRSDISLGQQFAQLLHAAGESAILGTPPDSHTFAVALAATAEEIAVAIEAFKSRGIRYAAIVEDEGPLAGQLLAIGVEPNRDNRVRKILYHCKQVGEAPLAQR